MSKFNEAHPKMSREERAKQFMPFAALKGYEEALRAKEAEVSGLAEHQLENVKIDMVEYDEEDLDQYDFGDN